MMKYKTYLYLFVMLLLTACSKEDDRDYATAHSQDGIVGSWRLVEIKGSDGTAQMSSQNMESENYVVTFESDGAVRSSDASCAGSYSFAADKPGNFGDNNLFVDFAACQTAELRWYSIRGTMDARIADHNSLILNFSACDEGCTRILRRLKK